jgi:hypothetical protein
MKHMSLTRRIELCFALIAVLTLLAAVGAIQLQQRIFYHRADRLLGDIRSLTLRQSTLSDAQVLFNRWKGFGKYDGECTEKHCEFQIVMETFDRRHLSRFFGQQWLLNNYVRLGARPALLLSRITVVNGIVWGKSFFLAVGILDAQGVYALMGDSRSVSRFPFQWPDYTWHPEYAIGSPGGCEGCIALYAQFTPYADSKVVQRLMDINLECVLPWSGCREGNDIMPGAWDQMNEDNATHPRSWNESDCNEQTVGFLGRDAESAGIFEVLATRTEMGSDGRNFLTSTVRLITPLKRMMGWDVGGSREIRIFDDCMALTKTDRLSESRPGTRFILLFPHRWYLEFF